MDTVLRAAIMYAVVLVLFQIMGKRALSEVTTFDLVLLLMIAEATQQGLTGEDYSLTNSVVLISALVAIDIILARLRSWWPALDRVLESPPTVIVEDGRLMKERMRQERVDESDILEAARETHGLERMDQIKYAVLERSGDISVIPKRPAQ